MDAGGLSGKHHSHSNESDKLWHRNRHTSASRSDFKEEEKKKSAPPFVNLTRVWRSVIYLILWEDGAARGKKKQPKPQKHEK